MDFPKFWIQNTLESLTRPLLHFPDEITVTPTGCSEREQVSSLFINEITCLDTFILKYHGIKLGSSSLKTIP